MIIPRHAIALQIRHVRAAVSLLSAVPQTHPFHCSQVQYIDSVYIHPRARRYRSLIRVDVTLRYPISRRSIYCDFFVITPQCRISLFFLYHAQEGVIVKSPVLFIAGCSIARTNKRLFNAEDNKERGSLSGLRCGS